MRAVEMTGGWKEAENLKPGFPLLSTALGNRSAIPTFPPPRPLLDSFKTTKKDEKKGVILGYRLGSSPGSSFDWKTLKPRHPNFALSNWRKLG